MDRISSVAPQCHFMALVWYRALRHFEYAMRVDEDVCLTRFPISDLFTALSVDYAYGLEAHELHEETVETFNPWVREHMETAGLRPTLPPLPTDRIFATHFFVSRVGWWTSPEVDRFLQAVNETGDIYRHRWGDAPIQSAALRLHARPQSVRHLKVDYLRMSTLNRVYRGEEVTFDAAGIENAHFRRLARGAMANSSSSTSGGSNAQPPLQPPQPPSSPPPPVTPPLPPLPPLAPGWVRGTSVSEIQDAFAAGQTAIEVPAGAKIDFGLTSIAVPQGCNTTLRGAATLSAAVGSRLFDVGQGSWLWLVGLTLTHSGSNSPAQRRSLEHVETLGSNFTVAAAQSW